jgi:hypothetical protein
MLVGGWQLSGDTSFSSRYFSLPTSYLGTLNPVQIYGLQYPIQDCRSTGANATVASCKPGYLYYNGYIPPNQINSHNLNGVPNGVEGVPSNYMPVESPINPMPATGCSAGDNLCGTDNVYVTLSNGTKVLTQLTNNGLHPYRNQNVAGPWSVPAVNASLFKVFPIRERLQLRLQMDAFNALNMPGMGGVAGATGLIDMSTSANSPRVLQWTARLNW